MAQIHLLTLWELHLNNPPGNKISPCKILNFNYLQDIKSFILFKNKMKKIISLILLSCGVVILSSCWKTVLVDTPSDIDTNINNNITNNNINDTTITYTNNFFSVQYPKDWHMEEGSYTILVRFLTEQKEDDTYREEIIIDSYSIGDTSFNTATTDAVKILKDTITDFKEINSKNIKINGEKAFKITFKWKHGIRHKQFQQVYLLKDKKMYVITYTALENSFEEFAEEMYKLTESFEFVN